MRINFSVPNFLPLPPFVLVEFIGNFAPGGEPLLLELYLLGDFVLDSCKFNY